MSSLRTVEIYVVSNVAFSRAFMVVIHLVVARPVAKDSIGRRWDHE